MRRTREEKGSTPPAAVRSAQTLPEVLGSSGWGTDLTSFIPSEGFCSAPARLGQRVRGDQEETVTPKDLKG